MYEYSLTFDIDEFHNTVKHKYLGICRYEDAISFVYIYIFFFAVFRDIADISATVVAQKNSEGKLSELNVTCCLLSVFMSILYTSKYLHLQRSSLATPGLYLSTLIACLGSPSLQTSKSKSSDMPSQAKEPPATLQIFCSVNTSASEIFAKKTSLIKILRLSTLSFFLRSLLQFLRNTKMFLFTNFLLFQTQVLR